MRVGSLEITEVRKSLLSLALTAVLTASLITTPACSAAQFVQEFDQYSNQIVPALNTVIAILALFGVVSPTGVAAKVDADIKGAQALVTDFAGASVLAQPTVYGQIMAAENALNADLNQVFALAHVADKNAQVKLNALIALIESAVQIGFNLVPHSMSKQSLSQAAAQASTLTPPRFVSSFNAILAAPTGNAKLDRLTPKLKLRARVSVFSRALRVVSFGRA